MGGDRAASIGTFVAWAQMGGQIHNYYAHHTVGSFLRNWIKKINTAEGR